jgi:hypothetical protein
VPLSKCGPRAVTFRWPCSHRREKKRNDPTHASASPPSSGVAADTIGTATDVARLAVAETQGARRDLAVGADVAARDTITTDRVGKAVFRFLDDTRMSVGPNSSVKLDSFVYSGASAPSSFVLRASKGMFRFATGRGDHDSYRIHTPAATIGVRGTQFDVSVERGGQVRVSVIDGEVILCPNRGRANFLDCVTATVGQSILSGVAKASVVLTSTLPAIRADLLPLTSVANAAGNLLPVPSSAVNGAAAAAGGIVGGATGAAGALVGGAAGTVGGLGNGLGNAVGGLGGTAGGLGGAVGNVGGPVGGAIGGVGGAVGGVGGAVGNVGGAVGGAVGGLGGVGGGALGGIRLGR